ncbi:Alpha-maltose-1-phosphate synthase [Alphaproteobacteria bacterium SO-S41]|nr:Alpha-maltose-1-phosphate synthase [Alphaproteobacteria bacterium SO-S41]
MTTVGFDALIYAWPPGGIATYQTGLMQGLRATGEVEVKFAGGVSAVETGLPGLKVSNSGRRVLFARNMMKAAGLKSDVHHLTAFWRPPLLRARRMVLTVHDMIPERLGRDYPEIAGVHYGKVRLAAQADAVICPSEAARQDVLELLKLPEDRVFAVPHGAPETVAAATGTRFEAEAGRYVLIVGRRGHYKNFLGVLPALGPVLVRHGLKLICVGGGAFTAEERAALVAAGLSDRAEQQSLSVAALAAACAHALCLVAPSRAEGFGLPLLEAMAYGAPVLASDIPVQREVGGDAVLWWDVQRPDSLAAALERLIAETDLRGTLQTAGRARAALYTWERTARLTAEIYRRAAAG